MTRNFNELFVKMEPAAQERVKARSGELLRAMALADLRRAQARTQQQLAETLSVNQAWISRVERQTDMYLSTLRGYIEALGGELELSARFENCVVRLDQFADLERLTATGDAQAPSGEENVASQEADASRDDASLAVSSNAAAYAEVATPESTIASATFISNVTLFTRALPGRMQLYGGGIYQADEHASAMRFSSAFERAAVYRVIKRATKPRLVSANPTASGSMKDIEGSVQDEEGASVTTAA
jgi:transcriptional regulator with XRE-family HTH domain